MNFLYVREGLGVGRLTVYLSNDFFLNLSIDCDSVRGRVVARSEVLTNLRLDRVDLISGLRCFYRR